MWKTGEIHSEESLQAEHRFWKAWNADQGYDSELQTDGQEEERVSRRFEKAGKTEHSQDSDDVVAPLRKLLFGSRQFNVVIN